MFIRTGRLGRSGEVISVIANVGADARPPRVPMHRVKDGETNGLTRNGSGNGYVNLSKVENFDF